jgi:hypothetical protein
MSESGCSSAGDEAVPALLGREIPTGSSLQDEYIRACLIHGIRHHLGFAQNLHGTASDITRALNARSIMSNIIPDIAKPNETPYCIWHPDIATEDTYRELASRYPDMKYQVGRACAVAGYVDLFSELNLLPEVHIAEEARESGCSRIYELIMSNNIKYEVMNDYSRTINIDKPRQASLNGDTAIRAYLDLHLNYFDFKYCFRGPNEYFNITEDRCVGEDPEGNYPPPYIKEDIAKLLYNALPVDLPTVNKDLLILMAAYNGDVDRYTRLRRPVMIEGELGCLVRGIYHHPFFAKWASLQGFSDTRHFIQRAITARFIMSNDLSRINDGLSNFELPSLIWYPAWPAPSILKELVRRKPTMAKTAAHACIAANYQTTFDELDVEPDDKLVSHARDSPNPYYLDFFRRKVESQDQESFEQRFHGSLAQRPGSYILHEKSTSTIVRVANQFMVSTEFDFGPYNGIDTSASTIELHVCAPDEMKQKDMTHLDYLYRTQET